MTGNRTPDGCAEAEQQLAELALGALAGRNRSAVLAHLDGCAACRAELEHQAVTADAVLLAAPEVEPPLGFEVRVIDRLGPRPPAAAGLPAAAPAGLPAAAPAGRIGGRPGHRLWAVLATVAVVVGIAVAFGAGWVSGPGARSRSAGEVVTRPFLEERHLVSTSGAGVRRLAGQVALVGGSPAWVLMSVRGVGYTGQASCVVTTVAGATVTVGTFWLDEGHGTWSARLPGPADQVRSARVLDWSGHVLASAALATGRRSV